MAGHRHRGACQQPGLEGAQDINDNEITFYYVSERVCGGTLQRMRRKPVIRAAHQLRDESQMAQDLALGISFGRCKTAKESER